MNTLVHPYIKKSISYTLQRQLQTSFREVSNLKSCNSRWFTPRDCKFAANFRGTNGMGSAFIFLHWFKLAYICIQV